MHGVICAGVILSVMGAAFFFYVLCAPHPWPVCLVCAGTDWLVPKSPVAFHTLGLGLLPVCITPSTSASNSLSALPLLRWLWVSRCGWNVLVGEAEARIMCSVCPECEVGHQM